jgi:hypothetical protein
MRIPEILALIGLTVLLSSGCRKSDDQPTVIWVTGALRSEWQPHGDYGKPLYGGLSRIARALEIHRDNPDILVDLGRFRYPKGIAGNTRRWRIRGNSFLKAMVRMKYNAVNVSPCDAEPSADDLISRARDYDFPLISSNLAGRNLAPPPAVTVPHPAGDVRFVGLTATETEQDAEDSLFAAGADSSGNGVFTILLTDVSEAKIQSYLDHHPEVNLVLWLNDGAPKVRWLEHRLTLGMGDEGSCLGRIEIYHRKERFTLASCDISGWLDGKPWRHHPAREKLLNRFHFRRSQPALTATLWAIPETLSPQKEAEDQQRQMQEELARCEELEDAHRRTPTDFAGSARCLECHPLDHPYDLARRHLFRLEAVRQYPVYERCLPCHATGFDDPAGFLQPWERPDLLTVTCEACHGGAYAHALEGKPPLPTRRPADEICRKCHTAGRPFGHTAPRDYVPPQDPDADIISP